MDQAEIVAFLERSATHGGQGAVERIDTHISHVFLIGARALKLKRAVKLPYVDFSSLEQRRAACEAEVAINRRTAPQLYLAVTPVMRRENGELGIGGAGTPADWLVVMRRFDQTLLFDRLAERGALGEDQVVAAAEEIARLHAAAEQVAGGAEIMTRIIQGNRDSVERAAVPKPLSPTRAQSLHAACLAELNAIRSLLDRRGAVGRVRDGHGDLHLRNICLLEGKPVLFDAIEFDPALRRTDVFYDFGFLLMDLLHRRLGGHANRATEAYVAATLDAPGLRTLPLFLGVRAIIRGHIQATLAAARPAEAGKLFAEAGDYFDLAEKALAPDPPAFVAIGGLSGSGKSTVAKAIAPRLGALPGALVLRSDLTRKRLAGVATAQRLPESHYTAEWTERVYAELLRTAEGALGAGHAVIVDAVSGEAKQRKAFATLARRLGTRFLGLWLDASSAIREARIGGRVGDASDADVAVARRQSEPAANELDWLRIDASGPLPHTQAQAEAALEKSGTALRRA
jgi:hypothetical protein